VSQDLAGGSRHNQMESVESAAFEGGDGETRGKNGAGSTRDEQSQFSCHRHHPCRRLGFSVGPSREYTSPSLTNNLYIRPDSISMGFVKILCHPLLTAGRGNNCKLMKKRML
jgi:hypothetical protein